jgi:sulfur-carrier protein
MIKVMFFARLREQLDTEMLELTAGPELPNMAAIMELLKRRGGEWVEIFDGDQTVLMAVNQEVAEAESVIKDGDEVAFFPPVTGG